MLGQCLQQCCTLLGLPWPLSGFSCFLYPFAVWSKRVVLPETSQGSTVCLQGKSLWLYQRATRSHSASPALWVRDLTFSTRASKEAGLAPHQRTCPNTENLNFMTKWVELSKPDHCPAPDSGTDLTFLGLLAHRGKIGTLLMTRLSVQSHL